VSELLYIAHDTTFGAIILVSRGQDEAPKDSRLLATIDVKLGHVSEESNVVISVVISPEISLLDTLADVVFLGTK
jgi:hypothetical protein